MHTSELFKRFENQLPLSGGQQGEWVHPEKGPAGETLKTHFYYRPGQSKRLLISLCGTHGPEALIGSQIQTEILKQLEGRLGSGAPSVLIIHNLNSFGSAWMRRGNHENVDLNRNCWLSGVPVNPDFKFFRNWLASKNTPQFWWEFAQLLPRMIKNGKQTMSKSVAQGQSEFPDSLFYVGKNRCFETAQLEKLFHDLNLQPEEVFSLDIHSGLGSFTQESLIIEPTVSKSLLDKLQLELKNRIIDNATERGYYPTFGSVGYLVTHAFPKALVCHITQEFGTYSHLTILKNLVLENSLWNSGQKQTPHRQGLLRPLFYPEDPTWRKKVGALGVNRFFELARFHI